jgi:hypothetical protein
MVRVMVPPESTELRGVNTRTGLAEAPETSDKGVTEAKAVIIAVMVRALTPGVKVASALDDIWKPPVTPDRAVPRVSPVRVMVMEVPKPVGAPPVVTMMVVLVDVAVVEDAKVTGVPTTLFPMAVTVPKK